MAGCKPEIVNISQIHFAANAAGDDRLFPVTLKIMSDDWNLKRWKFHSAEEYAKTFIGMPILFAYVHGRIDDYNSGHNLTPNVDFKTGNKYSSFMGGNDERIIGVIKSVRTETDESGVTWIYADGVIFAFYNRELVREIIQNGVLPVSAEIDGIKTYKMSNGDTHFKVWRAYGVTALGKYVLPTFLDSNIAAASMDGFTEQDVDEMQSAFERFRAASLDFPEPEEPPESTPAVPDMNNIESHANQNGGAFFYPQNALDTPNSIKPTGGGQMTSDKTQLKKELHAFFKDSGYSVMAFNDSGSHVLVLDRKTGAYRQYAMNSGDETFNPKRLQTMSCTVTAEFDGGETVTMSLGEAYEPIVACMNALSASNTSKDELIAQADEKALKAQEAMNAMEKERAQERCAETLAAVNAHHAESAKLLSAGEQIPEDTLKALLADIEGGKYNNSVEDGKWIGKERAIADYNAAAYRFVMDAKRAVHNSAQTMTWIGSGFADKLGAVHTTTDIYEQNFEHYQNKNAGGF